MKAVIVDLMGGKAAALCDNGSVVSVPDAGYRLGQTVEVHAQKRKKQPAWLRYASAAAAAAVLLVGAGGGAAYATPYGVVSLDVNPSIEYTINRFDYVLSVSGVNEDGEALLAGMDTRSLVHRRIDEALTASVEQLEAGDWLSEGEILLAAGAKRSEHAERLVQQLRDELGAQRGDLSLHAYAVTEGEIDEARRAGMSPGRQRALRELEACAGEDFVPADWADRPVAELFHAMEHSGPDAADTHPGAEQNAAFPQHREGSADTDPRPQQDETAWATPQEGSPRRAQQETAHEPNQGEDGHLPTQGADGRQPISEEDGRQPTTDEEGHQPMTDEDGRPPRTNAAPPVDFPGRP